MLQTENANKNENYFWPIFGEWNKN